MKTRGPMMPEPFQSWDDFRFFLATNKAGSFSKAASELGVTQPTISRRIENLEQRLGVRLFDRLPSGVDLTSEGESILDDARHIEKAVLDIQRNVFGSDQRLEGSVRISVADGLAAYWLTPKLPEFQKENPGISIEFQCSMEPADPLVMETDLSIRSRMPKAQDLKAVKLGTLHFVPWASPDYLKRHGTPRKPEDLLEHRLLDHRIYSSDDGDWGQWLGLARAANLITYVTNSSASMLNAIQAGVGIGMLPTYGCERVSDIVPLDMGLRTYSEIRLVFHEDVPKMARVRAVIEWIKRSFDHKTSPWFGEEFYPPTQPDRGTRSRSTVD